MNMFGLSNSALIAIYVVGVFLLPILFGIWQRDKEITLGDDILPLLFIAALWPVGAVAIVFFGAICLALVVPVWVFRLLTSLGVKMGNWIENARRRKKRRSAELAKTAMEQSMPNLDRPWDVNR